MWLRGTKEDEVVDEEEEPASLFDQALGNALRDEGIARADGAAPEAWKLLALDAGRWCAQMRPTFTTDDVWDRMVFMDRDLALSVEEGRAMGAVMMKLKREGRIAYANEMPRPSARPQLHSSPRRVWQGT